MTSEPGHGDSGFSRPFLAGLRPTADDTVPARSDAASPDEAEAVRPYFVTQGRVHDDLSGFDTVYALTAGGQAGLNQLSFEHRDIAELCRTPQSVVEISALLRLPLGAATVLTRDLAAQGYLSAAKASVDPASDPSLIMRLINAVHAL